MIIVWVHSNQVKESQKFSSHLNKTLRNKEPKSRSSIISLILFFLTYFIIYYVIDFMIIISMLIHVYLY